MDEQPAPRKRGRPEGWRKPGGVKQHRTMRLAPDVWEKLERMSADEGATMTAVIERLVREA